MATPTPTARWYGKADALDSAGGAFAPAAAMAGFGTAAAAAAGFLAAEAAAVSGATAAAAGAATDAPPVSRLLHSPSEFCRSNGTWHKRRRASEASTGGVDGRK